MRYYDTNANISSRGYKRRADETTSTNNNHLSYSHTFPTPVDLPPPPPPTLPLFFNWNSKTTPTPNQPFQTSTNPSLPSQSINLSGPSNGRIPILPTISASSFYPNQLISTSLQQCTSSYPFPIAGFNQNQSSFLGDNSHTTLPSLLPETQFLHHHPKYDSERGVLDSNFPSKWDINCKFIDSLEAEQDKEERIENAEDESNKNTTGKIEETYVQSSNSDLLTNYKPRLIATFEYQSSRANKYKQVPTSNTSESSNSISSLSFYCSALSINLSASAHLADLNTRVALPGRAPLLQLPSFPIYLPPTNHSEGVRQVEKPPVLTLVIACEKVGLHLFRENLCSVPASNHFLAPSNHTCTPNSNRDFPLPLTFVMFRNSIRAMIGGHGTATWRVDVQRVGTCIMLRRHLSYSYEDTNDVGHRFEQACTQQKTIRNSTDNDQDELHLKSIGEFRAVVSAVLGEYRLITSGEIDLCDPVFILSAPPKDQSNIESPFTSSTTKSPNLSFPSLSSFIELKSVFKGKQKKWSQKLAQYWLQSFIIGTPKVIIGYKHHPPVLTTVKINLELTSQSSSICITGIEERSVDSLATESVKLKYLQSLHRLLKFIAQRVETGKMYKLVQEERNSLNQQEEKLFQQEEKKNTDLSNNTIAIPHRKYVIRLYEIVNGIEKWPILDPEIEKSLNSTDNLDSANNNCSIDKGQKRTKT